MSLSKEKEKYTFADYLQFPDSERWEIIDGISYMQSAPTWQHQSISRELMLQFGEYLRNNQCQVFAAPFDLRLPEIEEKDIEEDVTNVYQPDLLVVCDNSRLRGTGYYGVPSLIIEILSPSTVRIDRLLKFNIYEKVGVKEYWIVEPDNKLVNVFVLEDNKRYGRIELYTETDKVTVSIFPDLVVDLNKVFDINVST
ncbi:Uma2 family endonuclease [Desulfosporosinus shakirovi]|uniref:Uma2 family endonuclease n=1 Tax=Desulfosporosinus shakirovi TaxID=2885154 RepID=UPI001E2C9000|nr:Uma2 family endonuclease [Desulfosporosinus sp. SRJS8]MCB8817233.1 Uma2 family endonuclease [Desulfosporosinus sp. SRJS8]